MSESLRDRVARVLYEKNPAFRWSGGPWLFDEVRDSSQVEMAYAQADALIAAGLVAEPDERMARVREYIVAVRNSPGLGATGHHGRWLAEALAVIDGRVVTS